MLRDTRASFDCINQSTAQSSGKIPSPFSPAKINTEVDRDYLISNNNASPPPFACDYQGCLKSYSTKSNLQYHKHNIHLSNKPLNCKFAGCGRIFINQSKLKSHMRSHTNEKPFQCEFCLKSFGSKGNLKVHLRIHSGERPYHCAYPGCKNSYKAQAHLSDHSRSHFNERPYECMTCHKSFMRSNCYTRHQQVHEGHGHKTHTLSECKTIDKKKTSETSEIVHSRFREFQIERSYYTIVGRRYNQEDDLEILETNDNE